ncbi:hypothetical protein K0U27_10705 [archaeon]|nr:hypothetical protein [archaeon]
MNEISLTVKLLIAVIATSIAILFVLFLIVLPLSVPHNPETIEWLNQAECDDLKKWIESKKGTLEKYQSTAKGIYDFKECDR